MVNQENPTFPEQKGPEKLSGTDDTSQMKEKHLRNSGKMENAGDDENVSQPGSGDPDDSKHLTDKSGEEKKEDYINTDERQEDLKRQQDLKQRRGL